MLRQIAKFLVKNIKLENTDINSKSIKLMQKIIDDKNLYRKYKPLILRLIEYMAEHKKFTPIQFEALGRIANNVS